MPYTRANNSRLYYEITGQGQPLVFIHGLGSSTRDWEYQVGEFSRSYEVITFDLRGHGRSDKPPGPYSIPMFAVDTAALLKELGVEPAHVVGVSLGGAVALQLALDRPGLVKTLTVVNAAPAMHGTAEEITQEVDRRVGIVRQLGMGAIGEALSANLFPESGQAELRRTFVERLAENDPDAYAEATRSIAHWNVMDKIGNIRCPTLVIASEHDYSPVELKQSYVKLMPGAQLVVVQHAHHAVTMEKASEFNEILARFLAAHS